MAVLACSCDAEESMSPFDSEMLGVYTIETWTRNDGDCGAEGPSVAADEFAFAIVRACKWESTFMQVLPCHDPDSCALMDCQPDADDGDDDAVGTLYNYGGWPFLHGGDAGGWRGEQFDGFRAPDHCDGDWWRYEVTGTGEALVLRNEIAATGSFPAPEDPTRGCPTASARAAAEGKTCERLEVLHLKRL